MTYPNLFVRNIRNSYREIYRVIDELGFGRIKRIEYKGNNAVVFMDWDIAYTTATRMILEEGRSLLLYYSDNRFWKVFAYKTREERLNERIMQDWLEEETRLKLEQEIIERERLEEQEYNDNYSYYHCTGTEQSTESITLNYGNVIDYYPIVRHNIRARIGLV